MRLFSNSFKCGKYKEVAQASVTDVFTTFSPLWSITEQTHGNIQSICFTQWSENKKGPIHIPASYSTTVRRFVFFSPKRYFSSLPSSFFPLTNLYTVSSKPFLWFFLAQSRLMAKTFCKLASLFFSFSRVLRHRKYSWQSESTSIFLHKWRHVPCVMTSSNIPSLSFLNIWTLGGLTALKSFNSYGIGFEHQHGTLAPEVLSGNT